MSSSSCSSAIVESSSPVSAGSLWADAQWGAIVIVAAGAILGLARWTVMRRDVSRLRPERWIGLTALPVARGWVLWKAALESAASCGGGGSISSHDVDVVYR